MEVVITIIVVAAIIGSLKGLLGGGHNEDNKAEDIAMGALAGVGQAIGCLIQLAIIAIVLWLISLIFR